MPENAIHGRNMRGHLNLTPKNASISEDSLRPSTVNENENSRNNFQSLKSRSSGVGVNTENKGLEKTMNNYTEGSTRKSLAANSLKGQTNADNEFVPKTFKTPSNKGN